MKKILIIPSWYATPVTKVGFFFQEQAEVLQDQYDIRVLFIVPQQLSRKKNIFKFFYQKVFKSIECLKIDVGDDYAYNNPPLYYYKYDCYLKNEKKRYSAY